MRLNVMVLGFVCLCAVAIGIAAPAVQDDDVRGAFLTTRPKEKPATSGGTAAKPSRRRPKPAPTPGNPGKPQADKTPKPTPTPAGSAKPVNVARVGLGLTLFMRDSNGLAVRVDPDHVFRKGDRVRVLLETNTDGYLYIFNTTNDGPAVMVYPDADLDEAGNYIQAHVPFEIPASAAPEERLRWLAFDEYAGTERLFFVFTREPLSGIPLEDELVSFCREATGRCPIRPTDEVWAAVQKEMQEPFKTDKAQKFGRAETASETRGLGLAKDDPEPSLVMMASSTRSTLVATLDLIHK